MKITKQQLKQIIKEELANLIEEDEDSVMSVKDMYDGLVSSAPEGSIEKFEDDRRAYSAEIYGPEDERTTWTFLDALKARYKDISPTKADYRNILNQLQRMDRGPVVYEPEGRG